MTPAQPLLLEVKFLCTACSQRLACDAAYGGTEIQCPSCGQTLVVPQALASAPQRVPSDDTTPRPQPARYPRPATLDPWTEEEWRRRQGPTADFLEHPLAFVTWLIAPPAAALFLLTRTTGSGNGLGVWGVLGLLIALAGAARCGVVLASASTRHPVRRALLGGVLSVCVLFLYVVIGAFGGCAAAMLGAAANASQTSTL